MTRTIGSVLISLVVLTAVIGVMSMLAPSFAQAEQNASKERAAGMKAQVALSADGNALVRGAEVTEVSGDTIRARNEWGSAVLAWTVRTDDGTGFYEKGGSDSDLDEIEVGDVISFSGMLDQGTTALTVRADAVRNWSLDTDDDKRAHAEARVEAKAETKTNWGWVKKMPIFGWFSGKGENY